jgi:C4-type Zn-finger protein
MENNEKEKDNKDSAPVDFMSRLFDNERENEKRKRDEMQFEIDRVNAIECPLCKSKDKTHYCRRDNNGVLGPGFASWILEEYFICKECGIHYSDIKKQ